MTLRAIFSNWAQRYFSDEEAVILLIVLVLGFAAIIWLGTMLAPFFAALVLAFLLQGVVNLLTRRKVPEKLAVGIVFVGFISMMIVGVAAKFVPVFTGVDGRTLTQLWAPFILLNTGCTLRVVFQTLTDFTPAAFPLAGISGLLEVTALTLWGVHLARLMLREKKGVHATHERRNNGGSAAGQAGRLPYTRLNFQRGNKKGTVI